MSTTRTLRSLVIVVVSIVIGVGCTVRQEVEISVTGGGEATVEVELDRIMAAYLRDLGGLVGSAGDDVFDLDELSRAFSRRPAVRLRNATTPNPERLVIEAAFSDLSRVLSDEADVAGLFSFSRSGAERTLTITVNRATVESALQLSPFGDDDAIMMLLPPAGAMSTDEYVEYLSWAFEEYDTPARVRRAVRDAEIALSVTVDGTVVRHTGGIRSGNIVRYRIPVAKLLISPATTVYSVTFR